MSEPMTLEQVRDGLKSYANFCRTGGHDGKGLSAIDIYRMADAIDAHLSQPAQQDNDDLTCAYMAGRHDAKQPAQAVDAGRYYLQDSRNYTGNCPMWWAKDGKGYVTRLDEAHRYTREEAMKQHRSRETDIPWPCTEIDALRRPTVDIQHMRPIARQVAALKDSR